MAVSRCRITGHDYWKVYRRWNDRTTQKYFRADQPNERESLKKAQKEDETLRIRQWAFLARQVFDLSYHILPNGTMRGVRRVTVVREGRAPKEVFQMRAKAPWEKRAFYNSVSIDHHGVDQAFARVVDWYCNVYGFDKLSEMRPALRALVSAYKSKLSLKALPETVTEHENDGHWISKIEQEIAEFKKRDQRMIVGR